MNTLPPTPAAVPLGLAAFQETFNKELSQFLDSKLQEHMILPNSQLFVEALRHIQTVLLAGGKRVRPYMCYLAYLTEGGISQAEAFSAGLALELFHMFALVHDDIIDKGLTRHGLPTTQVFVANSIGEVPFRDVPHVSDAVALLVGDLLFSWSYERICQSKNHEVMAIFSRMVSEVVAGQAIDVSLTLKQSVSMKEIVEKNELKTARYTFVNPMHIGRALAGSESRAETYTELGLSLGQAFQIQDDLLDVVGTVAVTGKEPFIDVEEGQHTLITQYVFENAQESDKAILAELFGKKLSFKERETVMALFQSTNAIGYARTEIGELLGKAEACIGMLPVPSQAYWNSIVALLRARVS